MTLSTRARHGDKYIKIAKKTRARAKTARRRRAHFERMRKKALACFPIKLAFEEMEALDRKLVRRKMVQAVRALSRNVSLALNYELPEVPAWPNPTIGIHCTFAERAEFHRLSEKLSIFLGELISPTAAIRLAIRIQYRLG